jgi:predicted transcriptional regulator
VATKQPRDTLVTQAELAKRLGVTRQAVGAMKGDGKLVMKGTKVLLNATLERLGDTLHPSYSRKALKAVKNGENTDDPGEDDPEADDLPRISLGEAQRRKAVAAAVIAELELAEKQGSLVSRAGAEKRVFEFVRTFRDAMLNFPVRNAAVIAAELGVPAAKVNAALERRLKDYLGELADRQLQL